MSKKHKKRKNTPKNKTENDLKKTFKKMNWRLIARLVILFALVFSSYQLLLKLAVTYNNMLIQQLTMIVYTGITTILAVTFIFINGGISTDIPTKEQLKDTLSDKEKEDFIELVKQRRAKAKKILVYLVPFIFTLLLDTLYLLFFMK